MQRFTMAWLAGLVLSGCAMAQFNSAIQGTITDASGAVIPGAQVQVTQKETGISRSATTSEDGLYRVLSLGPGTYTVTAKKAGFTDAIQDAVVLTAGNTLRVDLALQVSSMAEKVVVEARPPLVETEQGRVSGRIDQTELKDIPLNGQNVFNLLALQPGMVGRSRSSASGGGGRSGNDPFSGEAGPMVYASGERYESNSFTMDGSSINSSVSPGFTNLTPTADVIQEVRVVTNNVSAVDGRNAGSQVEVITKSGTNDFHGGINYYFQNNTLSARNEFEQQVAVFRKNQFGATLGGPIIHDRTFFFVSYGGLRQSGGRGQIVTVETSAFRDFVEQTRPQSIAAKVLNAYQPAAYPTSNFKDLGSPRAGVNVTGPADGIFDVGSANFIPNTGHSGDQMQGRIDHELRPGKDRLYGSYYLNQDYSLDGNVRPILNRPFRERSQFANINETHIFSPAILNEFRAGVIRLRGGNDTPGHLDLPAISISGITGFSYGQFPNGWRQTNWNFKDILSIVHGAHTFKMGGEYRREFANNDNTGNYIPSYSFASLLDFADDEALQMTRSINPLTGDPATVYVGLRNRSGAAFFNDDWKVSRKLSLTLGIRYEYFGPMTDSNNRATNLIYGPGSNYFERLASAKVDIVPRLYESNKDDFAPRFGFAWDPSGKGQMSIRGGYGLSYDHIYSLKAGGYGSNPPLIGSATLGPQFGTSFTYTLGNLTAPNYGYPVDPGLRLGLDSRNGITGARVSLSAVNENLNTPYIHNWFLGIQRELPGHIVAEINYVGSAGHHLLDTYNANRYAGDLLDGLFNGINPSFGSIRVVESATNSIYHGGTIRVRRDFQNGFLLQGVYTFGKSIGEIDDGSVSNNYMDANNHSIDRSVTSFDVPQQLSLVGVWQLPFLRSGKSLAAKVLGGWQLSGTAILQKGMPFNITNGASYPKGDYNADGSSLDRPNAPASSVLTSGWNRSDYLTGLFPASAFPAPLAGTDGNLGRNTYRGPGFAETDLSLAKDFKLMEKLTAHIRLDAFNAFNRVNLNNPVSDLNNSNFGRSTGADTPRVFQGSARIDF
ncbi:MAG TPA: carboxypeptidase regulatory-like domain-containing protein [Bryobacteraceae bacterium]|nr:carboxypeptidase regulatory-like domain-containing protein [Bryobacteraceae bacterium]